MLQNKYQESFKANFNEQSPNASTIDMKCNQTLMSYNNHRLKYHLKDHNQIHQESTEHIETLPKTFN